MTSEVAQGKSDVEVLIIARDEEANIGHAIRSVRDWATRVYVVDSGSTDDTCSLAESLGAYVVHKDWLGYARQKNWALDSLPWQASWTFILDADEVVLPELRDEVLAIANRPAEGVTESGFYINRYFIFLGRRIRHCGYYPSYNLRFFKRGRARYEEREVHEHILLDGPAGYLTGHLEHHDRRGLEVYMAKHNRYSTLEAAEIVRQMLEGTQAGLRASLLGGPVQRNRWFKHVIYPKLPAKWLWRFVYMYFLRLGVLDGLTGLRFCLFISAYELLISLKMTELLQAAKERGR